MRKGEDGGRAIEASISVITDGQGVCIGYVVMARDLTEYKRAEAALRESESKFRKLSGELERRVAERTAALVESEYSYRTLAENLPGMVYRLYLRESGRMRFFNDQVAQMTGYAAAELERGDVCSIDLLILPEDRDEVVREVRDSVKAKRPFIVEYRIRHKDGSERYFQERGRPVAGPDGAPVYIDGVIFDMTGLHRAQKEREAMLLRLNDAQKMEAVGALAGGIAHDFNNLLTVIRGDTELAMSYVETDGEAYASLGQVKKAAARAAELTRKLLLFSRNRHVMPEKINMNATVAEMVGMLGRLMGDGVNIEADLEPGLRAVMADASGMEQVIMNLVINARDSMQTGGTIKISTRNTELDAEGCKGRPGARAGRFVRLRVEDNGRGMDEDTIKHIFEPFFTAKEGVKGTGLGLSVVHGVVKGQGGWVEVESAPGKGSRFDVYLEEAGPDEDMVKKAVR